MFNLWIAKHWRRLASWSLGIVILIIVIFYGVRAILADNHGPVRLVVYAFSTQEEILTQTIFPAFEQAWEAKNGRDLMIEGVFGPSGTLAGQINLGAPADVALLSNEQHVTWLKVEGRVNRETRPTIVSCTPMVIVTRPDNPARITDFGDLAQPNLRLLHADPRQSGAGDWAVLAEYGSALLETGSETEAQTRLEAIWDNVRLLGPSARTTLTLFELGAGDAFITYEQDARLAQARGVPLEIVTPPHTIVAQHVAVIVDANVTPPERRAAQAFISFLSSETGQQLLAQCYLRPDNLKSDVLPPLVEPFTVDDLGGWSAVYPKLVETLWEEQIEPRLNLEDNIKPLEMRK